MQLTEYVINKLNNNDKFTIKYSTNLDKYYNFYVKLLNNDIDIGINVLVDFLIEYDIPSVLINNAEVLNDVLIIKLRTVINPD